MNGNLPMRRDYLPRASFAIDTAELAAGQILLSVGQQSRQELAKHLQAFVSHGS
jgi:hypothetical protein